MLNYMAEGMFKLILPTHYCDQSEFLPPSDKYKWECLVHEEVPPPNPKSNFELVVYGTKVNVKREIRIEKYHNRLLYNKFYFRSATLVL